VITRRLDLGWPKSVDPVSFHTKRYRCEIRRHGACGGTSSAAARVNVLRDFAPQARKIPPIPPQSRRRQSTSGYRFQGSNQLASAEDQRVLDHLSW
jgi:hypothetical protein